MTSKISVSGFSTKSVCHRILSHFFNVQKRNLEIIFILRELSNFSHDHWLSFIRQEKYRHTDTSLVDLENFAQRFTAFLVLIAPDIRVLLKENH